MGEPHVGVEAKSGQTGGRNRFSLNRIALAFAIALGLIAGTAFMAFHTPPQPADLLADPEALNDIAPAAGPPSNTAPNQSGTDIEGWDNAPSLDLNADDGTAAE